MASIFVKQGPRKVRYSAKSITETLGLRFKMGYNLFFHRIIYPYFVTRFKLMAPSGIKLLNANCKVRDAFNGTCDRFMTFDFIELIRVNGTFQF